MRDPAEDPAIESRNRIPISESPDGLCRVDLRGSWRSLVSKGGGAGEFEAVLEPEAGKSADCARDNRPHDEIFLTSLKESDRMVTLKISTKNIRSF